MIKIIKDAPQTREEIFSVTMKTPDVSAIVREIIQQVRLEGDRALFYLTEKFDKAKLASLRVSEAEIEEGVGPLLGGHHQRGAQEGAYTGGPADGEDHAEDQRREEAHIVAL